MQKKRVVVTGGTGFVGSNICRFLASDYTEYEVFALGSVKNRERPLSPLLSEKISLIYADITDDDSVHRIFDELQPNVVVHCAGNKNVVLCEKNPDNAFKINAIGTEIIADHAQRANAKLVYLSTDLVFDGEKGNYHEFETPNPNTVYGKSKFRGEIAVLERASDALICRSAGVFGLESPLFAWALRQLGAKQSIECFNDVFNTPTYSRSLTNMIHTAIKNNLSGILHTVGWSKVHRYELFTELAKVYSISPELLIPIRLKDSKDPVMLSRDTSLDNTLTMEKLGISPRTLSEEIHDMQNVFISLQ